MADGDEKILESQSASRAVTRPASGPLPLVTRFDRLELKLLVSRQQADTVLPLIRARLTPDPYGLAGRYRVVSVYFDNAAHDVYFERQRGLTPRHKLRVRYYGLDSPSPVAFVEIKSKVGRRVIKRRAQAAPDTALALLDPDGSVDGHALDETGAGVLREAATMVKSRGFDPTVVLSYQRLAFSGSGAETGLRVTFDDEVRYRFDRPAEYADPEFAGEVLPEGTLVLEVKTPEAVPYWLTHALGQAGCILQSFSKYCRALESSGVLVAAGAPAEAA